MSDPARTHPPTEVIDELVRRLRELVFAWAGATLGEPEPLNHQALQDTFKCLQASADYLEALQQQVAALTQQKLAALARIDELCDAHEKQFLRAEAAEAQVAALHQQNETLLRALGTPGNSEP